MRRRTLRNIRLLLGVLLLGAAAWKLGGFDHETLTGQARVVDGDTLVINGRRMRLEGLDAPELSQTCTVEGRDWPCGREAAAAVRQLVAGAALECELDGNDRYGRALATCSLAEDDLGERIVRDGWAVADHGYEDAVRDARRGRRGLWRGDFEHPEDWRAANGL